MDTHTIEIIIHYDGKESNIKHSIWANNLVDLFNFTLTKIQFYNLKSFLQKNNKITPYISNFL